MELPGFELKSSFEHTPDWAVSSKFNIVSKFWLSDNHEYILEETHNGNIITYRLFKSKVKINSENDLVIQLKKGFKYTPIGHFTNSNFNPEHKVRKANFKTIREILSS